MGRKKAYSYDPNNKARGKGRRRGSISTDVDATELTGSVTWYAAPSIPEGHKVVVIDGYTMGRTTTGNATPQYIVLPTSSAELINVVNRIPGIGANATTEAGAYDALASSNACFVSSPDDSNHVTDGLVLEVDASNVASYPQTGTTWYDLSGYENHGTLTNGPSFNSSGYITFDGSNDVIIIPNDNPLNPTTGLTIESWVNFDGNSSDFIFEKGNVNTQFSLFSHGTDIVFRTKHSGDGSYHTLSPSKTTADITNGRWHHIVGSWDGSTKRIYVDGVSKSSTSKSGNLVTTSQGAAIGRFGGTTTGYYFGGGISKVKVYNKGLSSSEVTQNYYKGNIITSGLAFALDAGNLSSYESGDTTTYSLPNSYSGSILNGVTHNSNGWWDFDGTNDKIELSDTSYWNDNVFGNATNFTIMCWTKCDNFYNWSSMIHKDNGGYYSESEGASLWVNASGFQAVFGNGVPGNSGNWGNIISYSTSNTTDWFHLAFTGDGSTLKFYVNNVLVSSQGQSNRSAGKNITDNPVRLGVRAGSAYYNGKIALPLFYTRSLTADEVAQNFEAQRARFGL